MIYLKRTFWSLIKLSGLLSVWRYLHRNDITIFMLHGVINSQCSDQKWKPLRKHLTNDTVDFALNVLSKKYTFISLDTAIDILQGKKPPQPYSIVLTFDDGYKNNITNARPILKKYNAPFAIFVATGYIDRREPYWFDRLDYAIQQIDLADTKITIEDDEISFNGTSRSSIQESFKQIRLKIKNLDYDDNYMQKVFDDLTIKFENASGKCLVDIFEDDDVSSLLTWDEIKEASQDEDITIGSHTVNHVRLNMVNAQTVKDELLSSKRKIENITNKKCNYLCYPYGNYSQSVENTSSECGYIAALTTESGVVKVNSKLTRLKRLSFPDSNNSVLIDAIACGLSWEIGKLLSRVRQSIRGGNSSLAK